MRWRIIAKLLASTLVVAVISVVAVFPGSVVSQSGCTDYTATTIHNFFNGDHIGQWIDYQSGSVQITYKFWSGANLTGSLVHTRVLDPSDNFIVGFNSGSFEYYTLSSSAGWRVCSTPPAATPTNTPTNTLTPSITLTPTATELIFPTETVTNTPTNTPTPHYEALILEQQQRTFQWLYLALTVLGSIGLLILMRPR